MKKSARIEPHERTPAVSYCITNGGSHYAIGSLRGLMTEVSPARSGVFLAEIATDSADERALALARLADVPLTRFLGKYLVPPELVEVNRPIVEQRTCTFEKVVEPFAGQMN